jgi:hypothetical protein
MQLIGSGAATKLALESQIDGLQECRLSGFVVTNEHI